MRHQRNRSEVGDDREREAAEREGDGVRILECESVRSSDTGSDYRVTANSRAISVLNIVPVPVILGRHSLTTSQLNTGTDTCTAGPGSATEARRRK